MSFQDFKQNTTRALVSKAIDGVLDYVNKDREKGFLTLVDISERLMGDTYKKETYENARALIRNPDAKYMKFVNSLLDEIDPYVVKMHVLNFGYQGAFYGYTKTTEFEKEHGYRIPWIILMDPTSACNRHCIGCWSAEYGHKVSLSYEDLDSIVTQGEKLGISVYMMTGGEPLLRKNDIVKLAEKHRKCFFYAFTNGTLIDQQFCDDMLRLGNISLALSIEGYQEENDSRRGENSFAMTMRAMKLLKENHLPCGTSICYTAKNYKTVTSDEFLDFLIANGVRYSWYFHYMPVGNNAATDLLLTPEQREYMYHRIREIRAMEGGKPIFTMDFQNDGEFVGGCVAGGKFYCHINPNGDVEPCVFIHYSGANIHDMSLLDCLSQPLFRAYQQGQPFNENHLRPCPMLENPECLTRLVDATGAHSTDLQSPESACHLCGKCEPYAENWAPVAQRLMEENPNQRKDAAGTLPSEP